MMSPLLLLSFLLSGTQATLYERATAPVFDESICSPNVTVSAGGALPPCISIQNIQQQCQPNGTLPINYAAHAQCLCNPPSSFFADWAGCRNCLLAHGGLSEKDMNRYSVVISSVSNIMCTGTPTAAFETVFSSVDAGVPGATSGATVSSDKFPGQTAVSLYYTETGPQGAGAITGNAAAATAIATTSTPNLTTSTPSVSQDSLPDSGSPSAAKPTGTASSSSSKGGALPTNAMDSKWLVAIAGGAALAAF